MVLRTGASDRRGPKSAVVGSGRSPPYISLHPARNRLSDGLVRACRTSAERHDTRDWALAVLASIATSRKQERGLANRVSFGPRHKRQYEASERPSIRRLDLERSDSSKLGRCLASGGGHISTSSTWNRSHATLNVWKVSSNCLARACLHGLRLDLRCGKKLIRNQNPGNRTT